MRLKGIGWQILQCAKMVRYIILVAFSSHRVDRSDISNTLRHSGDWTTTWCLLIGCMVTEATTNKHC
jgi:hypothetical protein